MEKVSIDFSEKLGKIKPMHAVNNGPVHKFTADQQISNLEAFMEAGIPYVRNHDAAFCATYGGEHTVDVNNIFPNFDADPYAEESYDFALTDEYIKVCETADTKTFYRLGSKIEHWVKKYNTLPPKDFEKWAVICEHIIRHYNEGWNNGFHYNLEYWEIWNEPDLDNDQSTNKRTWGGTKVQFFEFFNVAIKHLKKCFPNLKIGGPAIAWNEDWTKDFLKQLEAPIDFLSWHRYDRNPISVGDCVDRFRKMLDDNGLKDTESILNEWNYIRGWKGEDFIYSVKTIKGLKGSAYTSAVMMTCQQKPLDMLMYYDARPCAYNGLFNTDVLCEKLKGYYPFYMFNKLYKLGTYVKHESSNEDIYVCSAKGENQCAVMLTHFNDLDDTAEKEVKIEFNNLGFKNGAIAEYYLLDENHDLALVKDEKITSNNFSTTVKMPLYTSMLIEIKNL